MRTTLNIADEVFLAVQIAAKREKRPIGDVVTEVLRRGLAAPKTNAAAAQAPLHPFVLIPNDGTIVTSEQVYELMEREGI
jgi:hypothetical protein